MEWSGRDALIQPAPVCCQVRDDTQHAGREDIAARRNFRVEGRRAWFETIEEMQAVLDSYMDGYNQRRPHQDRGMNGRTPALAFVDGLTKPQQKKEEKRAERKPTKQAA